MNLPAPEGRAERKSGFLADALAGLMARPKRLAPKYLYDAHGSRLFDAICKTPEYYITRTELRLLREQAEAVAERAGQGGVVIEPGSGACEKVGTLLPALRPASYVPVEICPDQLQDAVARLTEEFPWLAVDPVCGDFTRLEGIEAKTPGRPLIFFPGSTIGNFEPAAASRLLRRLGAVAGVGGWLLVGVDLKKPPARLNAAYNDQAGYTAQFNLNLLNRMNRELGADFETAGFEHHAFYNEAAGRVEMHLVSRCRQQVRIGPARIRFAAGESIHTENSYKYRISEFRMLAVSSGFTPVTVWTDPEGLFSLHLLRRT